MNREHSVLTTSVLVLAGFLGCTGQKEARLEEALVLYRQNKLQQALPMLEQVAAAERSNADAQAWLAETYRRLGRKEDAVTSARRALALEPCHSFAHTVIADAMNPVVGQWEQANSESTWTHIMEAIRCDSGDGNAWLLAWEEAIHHGYAKIVREANIKLARTGFLTPAALAYGRWMLRGLPQNAILITNGDMDTYPPCAVQEAEGFRNDVAVVNRSLLNTAWYMRFLRDHAGVPMPLDDPDLDRLAPSRDAEGNVVLPSDKIFRAWTAESARAVLSRPLALAVTVDTVFYAHIRGSLCYAGAFLHRNTAVASATPDTAAIRAGLNGAQPGDFAGPWVSDLDHSPVRRMSAWMLSRNVIRAALTYCEELAGAGRYPDGEQWLEWAGELAKVTDTAEEFRPEIARLSDVIAAGQQR